MWVADRQNYFFNPATMDGRRLDENVVVVKLNGKNMFFDPGTAFMPYGMLPWTETGVSGLKLDKDGGSWLQTELPESSRVYGPTQGRIEVERHRRPGRQGNGDLLRTRSAHGAAWRNVRRTMPSARNSWRTNSKGSVPVGCEVELTNQPDWKSSSPTLVAEYTLKVPGWVSGAGRRALLPVGLFSAPEKHLFDHAERVQPIYFQFPFQRT